MKQICLTPCDKPSDFPLGDDDCEAVWAKVWAQIRSVIWRKKFIEKTGKQAGWRKYGGSPRINKLTLKNKIY